MTVDEQIDGDALRVVEREVGRAKLFGISIGDHDDLRQAAMVGAWRARQKFDGTAQQWPGFLRINVRNAIIDEQRRLIGRNGKRPRSVELLEEPAVVDGAVELEPEPKRTCGYCRRRLPLNADHFARNAKAKKPSARFDWRCLECRRSYSQLRAIKRRHKQLLERQAALVRPLAEVEREHIEFAVELVGDVRRVAELLEVGRATVYRRLADYAAMPPLASQRPTRNNQFGARQLVDECELELRQREADWHNRRGKR